MAGKTLVIPQKPPPFPDKLPNFLANSPEFGNKRRQLFLSTGKETK
ncbi:hypothetical protein C789_1849 [Microcystis aeruginosa FACHB-905 = DIANCHI905]|uniref:Uncharacterized protein n=1 Tax=Microcystis aeruginosa PCC 7806SL TaxID=1903187 RepID=A0AB33C2T7_MICA7|nr:hypothetical protein BH695_3523 [Microcystis aeruginosa PCC 7806SL]ELS48319.1 hypothetical protein C789_1849 [Microcystis aeruginosa FACHB-905 = DIANCHI905]